MWLAQNGGSNIPPPHPPHGMLNSSVESEKPLLKDRSPNLIDNILSDVGMPGQNTQPANLQECVNGLNLETNLQPDNKQVTNGKPSSHNAGYVTPKPLSPATSLNETRNSNEENLALAVSLTSNTQNMEPPTWAPSPTWTRLFNQEATSSVENSGSGFLE